MTSYDASDYASKYDLHTDIIPPDRALALHQAEELAASFRQNGYGRDKAVDLMFQFLREHNRQIFAESQSKTETTNALLVLAGHVIDYASTQRKETIAKHNKHTAMLAVGAALVVFAGSAMMAWVARHPSKQTTGSSSASKSKQNAPPAKVSERGYVAVGVFNIQKGFWVDCFVAPEKQEQCTAHPSVIAPGQVFNVVAPNGVNMRVQLPDDFYSFSTATPNIIRRARLIKTSGAAFFRNFKDARSAEHRLVWAPAETIP